MAVPKLSTSLAYNYICPRFICDTKIEYKYPLAEQDSQVPFLVFWISFYFFPHSACRPITLGSFGRTAHFAIPSSCPIPLRVHSPYLGIEHHRLFTLAYHFER